MTGVDDSTDAGEACCQGAVWVCTWIVGMHDVRRVFSQLPDETADHPRRWTSCLVKSPDRDALASRFIGQQTPGSQAVEIRLITEPLLLSGKFERKALQPTNVEGVGYLNDAHDFRFVRAAACLGYTIDRRRTTA
jgi:hypothetical protein